MVMNGRYAVLFRKLDAGVQADVLARMAELIEEEKEYEDKGNYGHLCNILPTIAIDEALQKNGKTPEEAFELISTHMWAALTPEKFRKMSRLPGFLPIMKKIIPLGFKMGSGKGWRYTWFTGDPKDRYHFECNECLYKHEFGKRGLLGRFGKMFCHSDISITATFTILTSSAPGHFARAERNATSALSGTAKARPGSGVNRSDGNGPFGQIAENAYL